MLRPDGYIKLIDLGVAREYKDQSTKDTVAFGTEGYAPPEQYGKAQTDARSDIYALGATLWHMVTGESPSEYPLPDVRTKNSKVGEGFAQVIIPKCTQLDRDLRYQNMDELVADLEVYEELTQEYFDKQKSKVMKFFRTAVSGIAMLVLSLTLFVVNDILLTQNYESQTSIAKNTNDVQQAENALKEAISYRPEKKEAYELLLNLYMTKTGSGTDAIPVLTSEKYNEFYSIIEKNQNSIRNSSEYGDIYYMIGKAIWDNYDDGSNSTDIIGRETAMNKSKEYFIVARDNLNEINFKNLSDMYIKITEFNGKINTFKDDNEGLTNDIQSTIEDYFSSLQELANTVDNQTSNKVKLNAYAIIQLGIKQYAQEFHSANISKNKVENLAKQISNGLNGLQFGENSVYNQAKSKCISSLASALTSIQKAYSNNNTGVGGK